MGLVFAQKASDMAEFAIVGGPVDPGKSLVLCILSGCISQRAGNPGRAMSGSGD